MKEQSRKMKEMNDKRAAEEERKQMEMEARQKLEKQLAKERNLYINIYLYIS